MATTAASLQPLKPAASTSLEHSGTHTGTDLVTPIRSTSQTFVPGCTKHKDEAHGFGILQHTGPPAQDHVLGLYRDGRVRNPVPSKLKGKTDARKGNFGVMHIDLSTTNETQERDAAAKRTSEGTQLAAKRAQTDRYVPFKRSKFVYRPEDQVASSPQQPDGAQQKTSPLTVAETKAEQARLLSLLRSLQPILVVDQLCKALAFFGEVSSAQSSANEAFPDSAKANGPGSLFVGWLAEIFPALGQESVQGAQHLPLKRPRGRPKGSKNMKGKKDNVARKRFVPAGSLAKSTGDSLATSGLVSESALDDSWVDVDDTAENEGEVLEAQLERNFATPSRNNQLVTGLNVADSMLSSDPAKSAFVTSTPKRRGRPKGSKNRPKQKTILNDETESAQDVSKTATGSITLPNEVADDAGSSAVSIPSNAPNDTLEAGVASVKKRKPGPGRPKGSKNRPKETAPAFEHDPRSIPALTNINHHEQGTVPNAAKRASQSSSAITILPLVHTEPPQNTVATIHHPSVSEPASKAFGDDLNNGADSKGIMRKRKSTQEVNQSNLYDDVPSTVIPAPAQSLSGIVEAVTSHSCSSPQLARDHDAIDPGSARAYQPAKRQRVSTELQQERELSGHVRQAMQPESHRSQPDSSAGHYDANFGGIDSSSLQKSRQQLSVAASRSALQQTPDQQSEPDPPVRFSSNIGTPGSSQQVEGPEVMNTYAMDIAGRAVQGIHNQVQPTQLHQHHQQQQQQQQLSPTHKRPNASQHRLTSPNTGQMTSTVRQSGSSFTSSTSRRDYHGLTSMQQPSFNAQMVVTIPAQEASHHSPMSRSMQHQSPAFHRRQAHRSQSSDLSSFQDYSDSSFLEMAGLHSAGQASLNMTSTSYGIGDGTLQRASPNINSSHGSASSISLPSFDGGNAESALRERTYHSLRR